MPTGRRSVTGVTVIEATLVRGVGLVALPHPASTVTRNASTSRCRSNGASITPESGSGGVDPPTPVGAGSSRGPMLESCQRRGLHSATRWRDVGLASISCRLEQAPTARPLETLHAHPRDPARAALPGLRSKQLPSGPTMSRATSVAGPSGSRMTVRSSPAVSGSTPCSVRALAGPSAASRAPCWCSFRDPVRDRPPGPRAGTLRDATLPRHPRHLVGARADQGAASPGAATTRRPGSR